MNHVRKHLIVVLICMSLIFSNVDIFSCDSFKGCELNVPLEIGHLNACLVLNFFSVTPRTFLEGRHFTYSPLILVHIKYPAALLFMVLLNWKSRRKQHFFVSHSSFFFCPIISLLFYVGILLISDVFVSVVQISDSVMHRCLFILFGFVFTYRWLRVFINFPMLFNFNHSTSNF